MCHQWLLSTSGNGSTQMEVLMFEKANIEKNWLAEKTGSHAFKSQCR